MYIYSKRCVLHFFAIYPPVILRLWYGYPTVRVGRWLGNWKLKIENWKESWKLKIERKKTNAFVFGGGWGCVWWGMGYYQQMTKQKETSEGSFFCSATRTRTGVYGVRGRCPRPLDDSTQSHFENRLQKYSFFFNWPNIFAKKCV